MSPFKALYGRKCKTPLMWSEVGERPFFGPESIEEAVENVAKVRENLKIAQSRQKSYADKRRRELTFEVGDHVYPKVSPLRGTPEVPCERKTCPKVCWTLHDYPKVRRSSLQATVAGRACRSTPSVPCVIVTQMPLSTRRIHTRRSSGSAGHTRVHGVS